MINGCQRFKETSINRHSPYAERIPTLSEIDSLYQNGDLSESEARDMATKMALSSRKHSFVMLRAIYN